MNMSGPRGRKEGELRIAPKLGLLEWFQIGDREHVAKVLADMHLLGLDELRTGVSWADFHQEQGRDWYAWLIPRLSSQVNLLPCFLYTPPSLGIEAKSSSPPREPRAYADFLDVFVSEYGDHFEYVELWNEPNNLSEWDWTLDREWNLFSEMVGSAAHWVTKLGKKTVLGGMSPSDPNWLRMMFERGVMEFIDVVGIHAFPGYWERDWRGWVPTVEKTREVLIEHDSPAEIWITETGYSTWRHDEFHQVQTFTEGLGANVERVYWYGLYDLDPDLPSIDGFHSDEREYHFGIKAFDGTPKLLWRLWAESGLEGVRQVTEAPRPLHVTSTEKTVLITGGAGFIGTNLAHRLLNDGRKVLVFDNLHRSGVERNLAWLEQRHGASLGVHIGDVRDRFALRKALEDVDQVFHFAAQVAVTTSVSDPLRDFQVNARGTLNLLEEMRRLDDPPSLLFTSTNKVYGGLEDIRLELQNDRYEPSEPITTTRGISEDRSLDFHSPYGCSKGTADQYVIDYTRTYGLNAIVFRMSCIYGPHQFGTEDQGWVAHFLIQALKGAPITLYGDGKQVRDILFVADLVDALIIAQKETAGLRGHAFNIGGGPQNSVSLLELLDLIRDLVGRRPDIEFGDWRPGDQRYYVSDFGKFSQATGWKPKLDVSSGTEMLCRWLIESREVVEAVRRGMGVLR